MSLWERKNLRGKRKMRERDECESEKEKTQKCGPPGLAADTGEGLLRGGAWPYGCMAQWNPRGGNGHISLHGARHRFLCTAVCGTRGNIDNDIRRSHLCDGSWIPADGAGEGPAGGKITCYPRRAQSYLRSSIMTRGRLQKQHPRGGGHGRRRAKAFTWRSVFSAAPPPPPFKQQGRES